MPTPRLYTNIAQQPRSVGEPVTVTDQVTTESIQVGPGGQYLVQGAATPTRSALQLDDGDLVSVQWKAGKPFMILDAQTRKGPGSDEPLGVAQVVEELFVSGSDLWFRNFDQATDLQLANLVPTISISTVKWGPHNAHFVVQESSTRFHVFRFRRKDFTPFSSGTKATSKLEFVRTEDLSTKTFAVATIASPNQTTPASLTLTPASPGPSAFFYPVGGGAGVMSAAIGIQDFFLDNLGNLIVSYSLSISGTVRTPDVPGNPGDFALVPISMNFPIVVDATNQAVILDGFTNGTGALFDPLPPSLVYNATDFMNFPGTWVPTGPGDCFHEDQPQEQHYFLEPTLIVGALSAPTPVAGAVRGYVAFANTFFQEYSFNGATCPGVAGARTTGAIVLPPSNANPVTLFPMSAASNGINFVATLDRVVWRKLAATSFLFGTLNQGGSDSEGFVTAYVDNPTVGSQTQHLTFGLRQFVAQRGFNFVLTDFAYKLDNPVTPIANEKQNFFLRLWKFGVMSLMLFSPDAGPSFYLEDTALRPFASLKKLTGSLTQPTALGLYALQVVNAKAGLPAHYQAIP